MSGAVTIQVQDSRGVVATGSFTLTVVPQTNDLTVGLVTGKQKVPYSALAKPPKYTPIVDPDFGTTIVRITDVAGDWNGQTAIPVYPTVPIWNCDESYMIVYVRGGPGTYALLNGKTYAFIKWLTGFSPADVEQFDWDFTNPDIIWFISGSTLKRYHVSTMTSESWHSFTGSTNWGDDPIYCSWTSPPLFSVKTGTSVYTYQAGATANTGTESVKIARGSVTNSPESCASGRYVFWDTATSGKGSFRDPATMALVRNSLLGTDEHGDLGIDANGNDFWATVSFDEGPGGASGALLVEWVASNTWTTIIGGAKGDPYPPSGTLISAKAFKNPGWVAVACIGNKNLVPTYQDQEIMVANVNTGKVGRVCHHRTGGGSQGYWAQPNVTLSPRGTRIAFPSDWNGGTTVDTYVVHLPTYTG